MMARLADNSYGKSGVKVTKVVRTGPTHTLYEFEVQVTLGGAFDAMYTDGDNSSCIPTDTMKNTVYALSRAREFHSPEEFAGMVAAHFIEHFSHVRWAEVSILQTLWSRITVGGRPHEHAFAREDSADRTGAVRRDRSGGGSVRGGLRGLEVIKTTRSGFDEFLVDPYTTLKGTKDRIFATSIDAAWELPSAAVDYNRIFGEARRVIPETFATHDSRSVQQTLYAMGEALLARVPEIGSVSFSLPNRHRVPVDLAPFGMSNPNEIFVATREPFGVISGTVARE
jgi:urate oxidase